ncbi:MAG: hypothetical protein ABIS28_21425 [Caldimonas sp.]
MTTLPAAIRSAACGLAWVALTAIAPAAAQEIRIGPSTCAAGTTLLARQAKAADVLKQMSDSLGFAINVEEPLDSIVNIQSTQPAGDLIALLLASRNAIVTQGVDPKCPGKRRVTAVWVLRAGGNGKAASARPGALPWVVTPEAREQEELYMRAHGMLPEKPASAPAN